MSSFDRVERLYADALQSLPGGSALEDFLHSLNPADWPPASALASIHARLTQDLAGVAADRAAALLARILARYDERYLELRQAFALLERLTEASLCRYDARSQRFWGPLSGETPAETPVSLSDAIARLAIPDDRERLELAFARAIAEGVPFKRVYRSLDPTTGERRMACVGDVRRDAAGKAVEVFAVLRDITDDALRQERVALYEHVLATINDVVLVTEAELIDLPGPRIVYVNPAFERMTGYAAAEVIGQTPRILQGPRTSPEARAKIRAALQAWQPITIEILNYRKDGSEFWVELAISPVIRESDGKGLHWVSVQRETTVRRYIAAQRQRFQKLEALGQLAAGIAHNFNNLLAIIQGYGEVARRDVRDSSPATAQRLDKLLMAAKRGAALVQDLLLFSRQREGRPEIIDVYRLASESLDMARQLLPAQIEIDSPLLMPLEAEAQALCAYLDSNHFSEALINLIVNARDAMPDGGRLAVTVARRAIAARDLAREPARVFYKEPPQGDYAMVAVRDTGIGMDDQTAQRLFEPFFTTKAVGQGTGLGLAMVYGFVMESGGFITVDSAPGKGTTVALFFPIASETAASGNPSGGYVAPAPLSLPPDAVALVVEDESQLRGILTEQLSEMGFASVRQAGDGAEALSIAEELGKPLTLVVSDFSLPKMDGGRLIAELAERGLCERFLLISGLFKQDALPALPPSARVERLGKPFSSKELGDAARRLLLT